MNKLVIVPVIVAIFFLASAENSYACRCIRNDDPLAQQVQNAFTRSKAVFGGEVVSIAPESEYTVSVKFKVSHIWKGTLINELTVSTANQSAMCGYEFEVGKKYLVYADSSDDVLMVSTCSRTSVFNGSDDVPILNDLNSDSTESNDTAVLVDEFHYVTNGEFQARFDSFAVVLENRPKSRGYIAIYGNKTVARNTEKKVRQYKLLRRMDMKKFVFITGKGDKTPRIKLWLVPEGAEPPTATD